MLNGGVFKHVARNSPGMHELVDTIEVQGSAHLFEWPAPFLYQLEVKEFYVNLEIQVDGGLLPGLEIFLSG